MTTLLTSTIATPIGPLTLVASDGVLHAASFTDRPGDLRAHLDPALRRAEARTVPDLGAITDALHAYFAGDLTAIDTLPVDQPGNRYFQAAWKVMREVPAGSTLSYRDLAARVSDPSTARAAGFACASNRIVLVVPCHRVIRTDGTLGDYYYGLDVKGWLLRHEGVDAGLPLPTGPPAAMAGAAARQAARSRRRAARRPAGPPRRAAARLPGQSAPGQNGILMNGEL